MSKQNKKLAKKMQALIDKYDWDDVYDALMSTETGKFNVEFVNTLNEIKPKSRGVTGDEIAYGHKDTISPERVSMYLRVFGKEQGTRLLNDMRAWQKEFAAYKAEISPSSDDDNKQ